MKITKFYDSFCLSKILFKFYLIFPISIGMKFIKIENKEYLQLKSYPDKYYGVGKIILNKYGDENVFQFYYDSDNKSEKTFVSLHGVDDSEYLIVAKHINGFFYSIKIFHILDVNFKLKKISKNVMYKFDGSRWNETPPEFFLKYIRKAIRIALDG